MFAETYFGYLVPLLIGLAYVAGYGTCALLASFFPSGPTLEEIAEFNDIMRRVKTGTSTLYDAWRLEEMFIGDYPEDDE